MVSACNIGSHQQKEWSCAKFGLFSPLIGLFRSKLRSVRSASLNLYIRILQPIFHPFPASQHRCFRGASTSPMGLEVYRVGVRVN